MSEYTREDLIKICEKAFVKEEDWKDRDSELAQCQLGECYVLLRAGCDFEIDKVFGDTIELTIYSKGFVYFEYGMKDEHFFYLPTEKRLKEVNNKDWY